MVENDGWLIMALLYFLPALVGYARRHRSSHAILALTALLGWTGIGWIVGLCWSLTGNTRPARRAL